MSRHVLLAVAVLMISEFTAAQSDGDNASSNTSSTTTLILTTTTTTTGATENNDVIYIAAGSAAGGVILLVVGATIVICVVVGRSKRRRRREKYSVSDGAAKKEKSPSSDGYTNALYSVDPTVTGNENGTSVVDNAEEPPEKDAPPSTSKTSNTSETSKTNRTSKASRTSKNSRTSKTSRASKASSNCSSANYDYAGDDSESPGSRSKCSLPGEGLNDKEKKRLSKEGSYEYAYATTSVDRLSSSTSGSSSNRTPQKRAFTASFRTHSVRRENELVIYMAPAMDENSLYAQFAEIRVKCLSRNKIKITDMIGSGQFGKVHQGEWKAPDGRGKVDVALKTLKEEAGELDKVKFLQEAAIMGQFSHPNVVKLYGIVTEGEPVMIVLELLPKGDLRNYLFSIKDKREEGDEHSLLSFCRQIAAGMSYLASKAFVHRDLAARNILVSEVGICKIADFGMSRDLMDENYYISHGGKIPVKWTAPEALHFKKFSSASDVWSYGCVVYEIWSLGHKPYEGWSNNQTIIEIDEGVRLAPPPGCPRAIYDITVQCWHPETSQRPTFGHIMERLSLPDTKLLKWSEEDKAADPEATQLGADLDAGLELFKDIQQRYLPTEEVRKESDNESEMAAPTYDEPILVTIPEDSSDNPLSGFELPLPSTENLDNRFIPPNDDQLLNKLGDIDLDAVNKAHSYEDPLMLSVLARDKGDVFSNV